MVQDEILIQQSVADPRRFGLLYDRYVDRIYAFAWRQTGDPVLAQDVTAATFEKALRHIQQNGWRGGEHFRAWLYRIARNEAVSRYRRQRWLQPFTAILAGRTASGQEQPETAVIRKDRDQALYQALQQLKLRDREVILLRYFAGLESAAVADVLGCSTDNVYLRLHRALQRLRKQLLAADNAAAEEVSTYVAR